MMSTHVIFQTHFPLYFWHGYLALYLSHAMYIFTHILLEFISVRTRRPRM